MPTVYFQRPGVLWALLVLPMLGVLWWAACARAAGAWRAIGGQANSVAAGRIRGLLRLGAMAALIVALAAPVAPDVQAPAAVVPVVFVLDVSHSMRAPDVHPNRLSAAVRAIAELASLLPHARTALVAVAQDAAVVCPPTEDRQAFLSLLSQTDALWMSGTGTALWEGLEKARRLAAGAHAVIVLASDGEDHGPSPQPLIERMRREGTIIHTLTVGTEEGVALKELPPAPFPFSVQAQGRTRAMPDKMAAWAKAGGGAAWSIAARGRAFPSRQAEVIPVHMTARALARSGAAMTLTPWLYALAAALLAADLALTRRQGAGLHHHCGSASPDAGLNCCHSRLNRLP